MLKSRQVEIIDDFLRRMRPDQLREFRRALKLDRISAPDHALEFIDQRLALIDRLLGETKTAGD